MAVLAAAAVVSKVRRHCLRSIIRAVRTESLSFLESEYIYNSSIEYREVV